MKKILKKITQAYYLTDKNSDKEFWNAITSNFIRLKLFQIIGNQNIIQKATSIYNTFKNQYQSSREDYYKIYMHVFGNNENYIDQSEVISSILSLTLPKVDYIQNFFI